MKRIYKKQLLIFIFAFFSKNTDCLLSLNDKNNGLKLDLEIDCYLTGPNQLMTSTESLCNYYNLEEIDKRIAQKSKLIYLLELKYLNNPSFVFKDKNQESIKFYIEKIYNFYKSFKDLCQSMVEDIDKKEHHYLATRSMFSPISWLLKHIKQKEFEIEENILIIEKICKKNIKKIERNGTVEDYIKENLMWPSCMKILNCEIKNEIEELIDAINPLIRFYSDQSIEAATKEFYKK